MESSDESSLLLFPAQLPCWFSPGPLQSCSATPHLPALACLTDPHCRSHWGAPPPQVGAPFPTLRSFHGAYSLRQKPLQIAQVRVSEESGSFLPPEQEPRAPVYLHTSCCRSLSMVHSSASTFSIFCRGQPHQESFSPLPCLILIFSLNIQRPSPLQDSLHPAAWLSRETGTSVNGKFPEDEGYAPSYFTLSSGALARGL